jgi:hypothetical protein
MLATNGIMNDSRPQDAPQILTPVNEDTDREVYELPDGEETLTTDLTEDRPPQGTIFWQIGPEFSVVPPIQTPTIRTSFGQMAAYVFPPAVSHGPGSESESESDTPPMPPLDEPVHMRNPGLADEQREPVVLKDLESKPEWWTDPWEMLKGHQSHPLPQFLVPIPPTHFQDQNQPDITVIARSVCRLETVEVNGVTVDAKPGPVCLVMSPRLGCFQLLDLQPPSCDR